MSATNPSSSMNIERLEDETFPDPREKPGGPILLNCFQCVISARQKYQLEPNAAASVGSSRPSQIGLNFIIWAHTDSQIHNSYMLRAVGIDRQNHFVGCELFESLPMEDSPWTLNNSNVVWWIQPCDTHLWIETPWDDLRLHLNQIQREIQTHAHHQSCRSEWMILCDNDLYFMLLLDWASLNTRLGLTTLELPQQWQRNNFTLP